METEIDLHVEMYPASSVERGIAAFSATGEFAVEHRPPYHRVRIRALGGMDVHVLRREFSNYVLADAALHGRAEPQAGAPGETGA